MSEQPAHTVQAVTVADAVAAHQRFEDWEPNSVRVRDRADLFFPRSMPANASYDSHHYLLPDGKTTALIEPYPGAFDRPPAPGAPPPQFVQLPDGTRAVVEPVPGAFRVTDDGAWTDVRQPAPQHFQARTLPAQNPVAEQVADPAHHPTTTHQLASRVPLGHSTTTPGQPALPREAVAVEHPQQFLASRRPAETTQLPQNERLAVADDKVTGQTVTNVAPGQQLITTTTHHTLTQPDRTVVQETGYEQKNGQTFYDLGNGTKALVEPYPGAFDASTARFAPYGDGTMPLQPAMVVTPDGRVAIIEPQPGAYEHGVTISEERGIQPAPQFITLPDGRRALVSQYDGQFDVDPKTLTNGKLQPAHVLTPDGKDAIVEPYPGAYQDGASIDGANGVQPMKPQNLYVRAQGADANGNAANSTYVQLPDGKNGIVEPYPGAFDVDPASLKPGPDGKLPPQPRIETLPDGRRVAVESYPGEYAGGITNTPGYGLESPTEWAQQIDQAAQTEIPQSGNYQIPQSKSVAQSSSTPSSSTPTTPSTGPGKPGTRVMAIDKEAMLAGGVNLSDLGDKGVDIYYDWYDLVDQSRYAWGNQKVSESAQKSYWPSMLEMIDTMHGFTDGLVANGENTTTSAQVLGSADTAATESAGGGHGGRK